MNYDIRRSTRKIKIWQKSFQTRLEWERYVFLISGEANADSIANYYGDGNPKEINALPSIGMYTIDSTGRTAFLNGWLASQTDMLSDDWVIKD